jgi:hypothetical protein
MTGVVVNEVEVIGRAPNPTRQNRAGKVKAQAFWLCRCRCGNTFVTLGYRLRKRAYSKLWMFAKTKNQQVDHSPRYQHDATGPH